LKLDPQTEIKLEKHNEKNCKNDPKNIKSFRKKNNSFPRGIATQEDVISKTLKIP